MGVIVRQRKDKTGLVGIRSPSRQTNEAPFRYGKGGTSLRRIALCQVEAF